MSNAAKIKNTGPSAFGYNVAGCGLSEEIGGGHILYQTRRVHPRVGDYADRLRRYATECQKEGIIPTE